MQDNAIQSSPHAQHKVVALAGQPNTGKSTIFNRLTGLNQAVSNWPGKTVEKKSGTVLCNSRTVEVVDLPGTYCLTAASAEEQIARDFILESHADLVVVVVNARSIERTFYYLSEIVALDVPYIVAVNMMDMAEDAGIAIDVQKLSEKLRAPVVPLKANRGEGIEALCEAVDSALSGSDGYMLRCHGADDPAPVWLSSELTIIHDEVRTVLEKGQGTVNSSWNALKIMESDSIAYAEVSLEQQKKIEDRLSLEADLQQRITSARYAWIGSVLEGCKSVAAPTGKMGLSTWDRFATHPVGGIAALIGVFFLTTFIGLTIGMSFGLTAREGFDHLEEIVGSSLVLADLPWVVWVVRGVIRGAGSVITVTPVIALFTFMFALLEDVGYMARAAYVMDRVMSKIGLNGRAFVPFLFSVPCTIIGTLACRATDTERQRFLTRFLIPLVPCSAKLAISSVIALWFFSPLTSAFLIVGLFITNCLLIALVCKVTDHFLFAGEEPAPLIVELPAYQKPHWKSIGKYTFNKAKNFVYKAATVLVAFSALLSFFSYFPTGEIETSLFGMLGQMLTPVSDLMGLNWRMLTVLFASLLNKEAMLATASVIFATTQQEMPQLMQQSVSTAGALAFMYAQNVFLPCFAALCVLHAEGSRKYFQTAGIIFYTCALSLGGGILVYQIAQLLFV